MAAFHADILMPLAKRKSYALIDETQPSGASGALRSRLGGTFRAYTSKSNNKAKCRMIIKIQQWQARGLRAGSISVQSLPAAP